MNRLAIITARGGSKRIPRKNIKPFAGRPIIGYPIQAARDSNLFDEVMVSTDDDEIAAISRSLGASVPFMRTAATSNDTAGLADVALEVLGMYRQRGVVPQVFCLFLPTAPFVTAALLQATLERLESSLAPAVLPIVRFSYPILRALSMDASGQVSMIWPEHLKTRSQDLAPAYHDAGLFYWCQTTSFLDSGRILGPGALGHVIDESTAQDIDTPEDWNLAEMKFQIMHSSGKRD